MRSVPQATEWQRIGNQIDAAMIFAGTDFVSVHFWMSLILYKPKSRAEVPSPVPRRLCILSSPQSSGADDPTHPSIHTPAESGP